VGLGFLFVIIFTIAIYSSFQIEKLSKEANTILKDNYDSLVFCKNMLLALDNMDMTVTKSVFGTNLEKAVSTFDSNLFEQSKSSFETNLSAEKNNITEVHEREYVSELSINYGRFINLCSQIFKKSGGSAKYFGEFIPTYTVVRESIVNINDLNMQAVERKSQSTGLDANRMIISMAAIGTICILLAFFYFWYFPFYVSNTISYLAKRMRELLQRIGIKVDTKTKDEAFILLQSIDLLENKYAPASKAKKGK
jgi:hypothetical protein